MRMLATSPEVTLSFQFLLSFILLLAGIEKLRGTTADFQELLFSHGIIPQPFQKIAASLVPIVEVSLGLGALVVIESPIRSWIMSVITTLFFLYAIYLLLLLRSGKQVSCGCLSASSVNEPATGWHLARAIMLFVLSLACALNLAASPPIGVVIITSLMSLSAALLLSLIPSLLQVEAHVGARLRQAQGGSR